MKVWMLAPIPEVGWVCHEDRRVLWRLDSIWGGVYCSSRCSQITKGDMNSCVTGLALIYGVHHLLRY